LVAANQPMAATRDKFVSLGIVAHPIVVKPDSLWL
jgi:hypothetical protein